MCIKNSRKGVKAPKAVSVQIELTQRRIQALSKLR